MHSLEIHGKMLETDEEGFLQDPQQWDCEVARALADAEGLEMDAPRWLVVNFVRDYYEAHQTVPEAREAIKHIGSKLGNDVATRKYLYRLFPYGYGQQACKIAGMRKPRKLMLDV